MRLYFFLVWLEFISTNAAKITHGTGVRVTTNRNTWNYKFLMVKKNEYLSERAFEVCVLAFPPLFWSIHLRNQFRFFVCLFGLFLGFSCSGSGVSPKEFAHFCHKPLKVHFKYCETLWYPPLTINILKPELQGEMGMTINTAIRALLCIFHSE